MAVITIDLMNPEDSPAQEPERKKPALEQREVRNPNRRTQKQVISIDGSIISVQ